MDIAKPSIVPQAVGAAVLAYLLVSLLHFAVLFDCLESPE